MCSNQPTIVGQSVTVIAAEKVTWLRQQKRGNLGIKLASRAKASQNSTRFCGDRCQVLGKTHSKILEKKPQIKYLYDPLLEPHFSKLTQLRKNYKC